MQRETVCVLGLFDFLVLGQVWDHTAYDHGRGCSPSYNVPHGQVKFIIDNPIHFWRRLSVIFGNFALKLKQNNARFEAGKDVFASSDSGIITFLLLIFFLDFFCCGDKWSFEVKNFSFSFHITDFIYTFLINFHVTSAYQIKINFARKISKPWILLLRTNFYTKIHFCTTISGITKQ